MFGSTISPIRQLAHRCNSDGEMLASFRDPHESWIILAPPNSNPHKMPNGPIAQNSGSSLPNFLAVVKKKAGKEPEEVSNIIDIPVGSDAQDGVNFHDYLQKYPDLLEEGLKAIHRDLSLSLGDDETVCYGFELVERGSDSFFRPLSHFFPASGSRKPVLPESIPLASLVRDIWNWHLLGYCENFRPMNRHDPAIQQFLGLVRWHALVRLQQGGTFLGYFKIAGLGAVPDQRYILYAFYAALSHIRNEVNRRRILETWTLREFQDCLLDVVAGLQFETNRTIALSHVADVLTAHVGAGWNRAAFFGLIGSDTLRCLYAQGGDGSEDWSLRVQQPLRLEVQTVREFLAFKRTHPDRSDDPYRVAAAPEWPVEIRRVTDPVNNNLIARLWRHNGDVAQLPAANQEWEQTNLPMAHMSSIDRAVLAASGPLAAVFDSNDPCVKEVERDYPNHPVFVSKNGQYWLMPWLLEGKILGVWLLDVANWKDRRAQNPNPPSLALSNQILSAFSTCFRTFHRQLAGGFSWN